MTDEVIHTFACNYRGAFELVLKEVESTMVVQFNWSRNGEGGVIKTDHLTNLKR